MLARLSLMGCYQSVEVMQGTVYGKCSSLFLPLKSKLRGV